MENQSNGDLRKLIRRRVRIIFDHLNDVDLDRMISRPDLLEIQIENFVWGKPHLRLFYDVDETINLLRQLT